MSETPRQLAAYAEENPETEVGIGRARSTTAPIWHHIGAPSCKTTRASLRVESAASLVEHGFGEYRECQNCRPEVSDRSELCGRHAGECPFCGEFVAVVADHLRGCDGGAAAFVDQHASIPAARPKHEADDLSVTKVIDRHWQEVMA